MSVFPKYDSYKNSGVEWVGDVPKHWDVLPGRVTLSLNKEKNMGNVEDTVLSLSYGRLVIKSPEKLTGLVPESFEGYQIINPGDIIIRPTDLQNDWTSLRVGLAKDRGIITSAYLGLKHDDKVSSEYLYYLLHSYDLLKVYYGMGTGLRQNLSWDDFKYLPLTLPPKSEQDRIVTFLDQKTVEIDALIAKKQRQIELLDEQKAILINRAVTRGLNPNAKLKPSGIEWIGEIPVAWKVMKLRRILATSPKNGISPPISPEGGTPTLSIAAVKGGRVSFGDSVKYADISRREAAQYEISEGDILALRGNGSRHLVATCGIVGTDSPSRCIYPDLLIRLVPDKRTNPSYFVSLMNGPLRDGIELASKTSAGIWKVSGESLSSLSVPQPPLEEQNAIVEHVTEITTAKQANEDSLIKQIKSLNTLRSTLIAHAVTGRIKVA